MTRGLRGAPSKARTSSFSEGRSPLGLPYTLSRSPLRRLTPFACLTRFARSHLPLPRGLRSLGLPRHALSLAASTAHSVRVAHALRSFASPSSEGPSFPRTPRHALSLAASTAHSV